ncbi:hypothetical protein ES703_82382 [subsurface metagenome]
MPKATVLLPQPDSPTRPRVSPRWISKKTSRTAGTSPLRILYEMARFSTFKTGVFIFSILYSPTVH